MADAKHAQPDAESVHPTGVLLSDSEIQHPSGAVTEEPELEADTLDDKEPELEEQIEPKDVQNGGE